MKPPEVRISPGFWAAAALLIYLDQDSALPLLFFSACAAHELGHIAAAIAFGLPVRRLTLSALGAQLDISRRCSPWQEGVMLAAGPGVNLLSALLMCRCTPWQTAGAVHLLLGCFNLLPVQPLDGGELAELLFSGLFSPRVGWTLCRGMGWTCCVLLSVVGIRLALYGSPGLLALALWLASGMLRCQG